MTTTATIATETRADFIKELNRGPITSVFVPAPSCTETLRVLVQDSASYLYSGHAYNPYFQPGCMPTGTRAEGLLSDPKRWDSYYYSPAICPQSWTPVTTFTSSWYGVDPAKVIPLPAETTAVLCCPSGYSKGRWGYACASNLAQDTSVTYFIPYSSGENWYPGSVTIGKFLKGALIVGDGVPVWYQSTDSNVLAAATQTATSQMSSQMSSQTSSQRTSQSLGSTPPPTTSPGLNTPVSNSDSGLSTGAKIGLGVGIPLAIILGLILGWLIFRRRKAKTSPHPSQDMAELHDSYASELAAPKTYYAQSHELETPRYEMPGHSPKPQELSEANRATYTGAKIDTR